MFDVITIGSATRDVFLKSKAFHILKEDHLLSSPVGCFVLGAKIDVDDLIFTTGGSSTNAAVSFARKKLKVACMCSIGDDFSGQAILEELKNEKIDTDLVQISKDYHTDYSTILHAGSGERTILVYRGASNKFGLKDDIIKELKSKWLYIGTVEGKISSLGALLEHSDKTNIKTAFNPSNKELNKGLELLSPIIKKINVLILNLDEASFLTKLHKEDISAIMRKLSNLVKDYIIITDGKRGSYVVNGRYYIYSSTFPEKSIVDRTGAGDAFGSGFVFGLIRTGILDKKISSSKDEERDLVESLRIANANSTSVIENIGAKNYLLKEEDLCDPRWNVNHLTIKKDFL